MIFLFFPFIVIPNFIHPGGIMEKRILIRSRVRTVNGSFAFIPHRFLTDGFLKRLEPRELLLYLFLCLASDCYGLSYYGDSTICRLLKLSSQELKSCRDHLIEDDLIAYEAPIYQVLELPLKKMKQIPINKKSSCSSPPASFSQLIKRLDNKS
jgi:hypothetical protein